MTDAIYKIFSPSFEIYKDDINKFIHLNGAKSFFLPEVKTAFFKANHPYLHWEQLKYKTWIPNDIFPDKEIFWFFLKWSRQISSILTPVKDTQDNFFKMNINEYDEFLHTIDKEMAGNFMDIAGVTKSDKQDFITQYLIKESIASSQLEGASTARVAAKKMLLEGRKPQNLSEQMIVNNYRAMLAIEQEFCKEPLSLALLYKIHAIITEKTLVEDNQGKLRETFNKAGEKLKIINPADGAIMYIAPDKAFVEMQLARLIDFANDNDTNNSQFIHPVIKGIILHFWLGLLHPFEDGNGRLARILFYWYMLKNSYWALAYLSLSEKIKKSSTQYRMAYIYSEQDDNDLTYFIDYHIRQLKLAQKEFQTYVKKQLIENHSMISVYQKEYDLNDRQIKLLHYLYKNRQARTNISAYQSLYGINKNTAITDLKTLCNEGFLFKKKQGRNTYYYPTEKINTFFKF